MNDNLKERLTDMSVLASTRTPADALKYIEELEAKLSESEALLAKAVEALQGLVPILCEGFEDGCGKLSRHDCAACEGYATLAELTGGKDE